MSAINIGNITNATFKVGGADCSIYLGSVKLYPKDEPTPTYDFKLHYTTSGGTEVTINCDESWSKPANSVLPTINLLEIGDCTTEIPTSGFTSKGGTTSKPHYYSLQICPKFTMSDSVTKINNYGMHAFRYATAYTPTLEESILSKNITYIGQMGLTNWKFGDISFPNNFSGFSGSFSYITASTITIGKNAYLASNVFSNISANTITIDDGFNNPTTNGLFSSVSANTINIGNGTLAARTDGCFVTNCVIQNLNINSNFDTNYPLFANRGTIKNVTYGNDVTVIGGYAFSGRTELSSVVIGNSVTNIGSYAFANCSSLTSIIINATTPPTLGGNAFNGSTCQIYVPSENVNAYKTASGWSTYASKIQPIS
mgnify:CR=1 FL=1